LRLVRSPQLGDVIDWIGNTGADALELIKPAKEVYRDGRDPVHLNKLRASTPLAPWKLQELLAAIRTENPDDQPTKELVKQISGRSSNAATAGIAYARSSSSLRLKIAEYQQAQGAVLDKNAKAAMDADPALKAWWLTMVSKSGASPTLAKAQQISRDIENAWLPPWVIPVAVAAGAFMLYTWYTAQQARAGK